MMDKQILLLACVTILFVSCKNDQKNDNSNEDNRTISITFNQLLDDYYEEGLKLNPITATFVGDSRYNNRFPNTLSSEHKSEIKAYYANYLEKLVNRAQELKVMCNVVFLEFVDDYAVSVINASSLLISLAKKESFPIYLVNALACGVPVLTTEGSCNGEMLGDCEAVYEVDDLPASIEKGIVHCLTNLAKNDENRR